LAEKIQHSAKSVFPASVSVSLGGGVLGSAAINEVMVRDKILNVVQILGCVFLISAFVFRSIVAGLLIVVPLIAAVVANFGLMGWLGVPLQTATSFISALAVGIGADYAIYMTCRMREELRENKDEHRALQRAFFSAGKAILFVSSAMAGGFGVLVFSIGYSAHLWSGLFVALAMLVSSIASLTIFPALILQFRPKFIFERNSERGNHETQ
jgi:predicted RND superfamily exporter protein